MKMIWIGVAALVIALAAGQSGGKTEVAELLPIEVIAVRTRGDQVSLCTDTQDTGRGRTVSDAFDNLRQSAAGEVFLETADYLILDAKSLQHMEELATVLRPNCRICICEETVDLQDAAAYLRIHKPQTTVREYMAGMTEITIMTCTKGKMELVRQGSR